MNPPERYAQLMQSKDHYRHTVLQTAFHRRTSALARVNEWHRWMDYTVPDMYFDADLEYFAIRNSCAVFDLCPMSKYHISGPDAEAMLNRMLTRDVSKIRPGRVGYALWCDDEGQVIDDGTVFHLREGEYRLCSQERQLDWLKASSLGFDVQVHEDTHEIAALAFQGPTSCAVLRRLQVPGIDELKPFGLIHVEVAGIPLMISRTGFTGDLGYELWTDVEHAEPLWDALFEAGRLHGITPMGTHALEMSRIEAGYIQAGVDFNPSDHAVRPGSTRSPLELDMAWLVDFKKPNFTGRAALQREARRGVKQRLVKLEIDGNKPAHNAFIYNARNKVVGIVTSAMWSPSAKNNIALAFLDAPWGREGDSLRAEVYYQTELVWSRAMVRARAHDGPFWNPPRRSATPPADY